MVLLIKLEEDLALKPQSVILSQIMSYTKMLQDMLSTGELTKTDLKQWPLEEGWRNLQKLSSFDSEQKQFVGEVSGSGGLQANTMPEVLRLDAKAEGDDVAIGEWTGDPRFELLPKLLAEEDRFLEDTKAARNQRGSAAKAAPRKRLREREREPWG